MIKNLFPSSITLFVNSNGSISTVTFPGCEKTERVNMNYVYEEADTVDGITVINSACNGVANLPPEEKDTWYIVPADVAKVMIGRNDLLVPICPVKTGGQIIGYQKLMRLVKKIGGKK